MIISNMFPLKPFSYGVPVFDLLDVFVPIISAAFACNDGAALELGGVAAPWQNN
jgi:hypothetical protein